MGRVDRVQGSPEDSGDGNKTTLEEEGGPVRDKVAVTLRSTEVLWAYQRVGCTAVDGGLMAVANWTIHLRAGLSFIPSSLCGSAPLSCAKSGREQARKGLVGDHGEGCPSANLCRLQVARFGNVVCSLPLGRELPSLVAHAGGKKEQKKEDKKHTKREGVVGSPTAPGSTGCYHGTLRLRALGGRRCAKKKPDEKKMESPGFQGRGVEI